MRLANVDCFVLPGIRKDGIQVSIYEHHVTVNAEAREEKAAGDQASWLLKERSFGGFTRTVSLPKAVDEMAPEPVMWTVCFTRSCRKKKPARPGA